MKIKVSDEFELTEIRHEDKSSFIKYLSDDRIYRNTLSIPSPYKESDADQWIRHNQKIFEDHGTHYNLAIRQHEELVGVIGLLDPGEPHPHRAEVGYWLAPHLWNRGIMTTTLRRFMSHAFEHFDLSKLTAYVFAGNSASEKVLAKCGFQQEGRFQKHYVKDGRSIDSIAFGILREEFDSSRARPA